MSSLAWHSLVDWGSEHHNGGKMAGNVISLKPEYSLFFFKQLMYSTFLLVNVSLVRIKITSECDFNQTKPGKTSNKGCQKTVK